MKKIVTFMLIFVLICSGLYIVYKREFDQFNPLYKEQYVYTAITKPGKVEGKDERIRYRYNLTGTTAQGEKEKVTFSSSKELDLNSYVRVLSKGAYTKEWILIKKEDIPNQLLE
ncbi:YxeA family protein [Paenibacillus sp. Marseille-Q7038]